MANMVSRAEALRHVEELVRDQAPQGTSAQYTNQKGRFHVVFTRLSSSAGIVVEFEVSRSALATPTVLVDSVSKPRTPIDARTYSKLYGEVVDLACLVQTLLARYTVNAKLDLKEVK